MFQKNRGYILLESIISLLIFIIIIFFINKYLVYIFRNNFNMNQDYNILKIEIDFFEHIYFDIKLRDIEENSLEVSNTKLIIKKGLYLKYEFKNEGIYISNSKTLNGKYGSSLKIVDCDECYFFIEGNLLFINLSYKGVKFEKVIHL